MILVGNEILLQLWRLFIGRRKDAIQPAICVDELGGRLLSNSGNTRQVVRWVTRKAA